MNKILSMLVFFIVITSCDDTEDFVYDNVVTAGDIKIIRLKADHNSLLPNGRAVMRFYVEAFNILEFPSYTPTYHGDSAIYIPEIKRDTSLIPIDQLPQGLFKLVDETGLEYPDFQFSTTDTQMKSLKFHVVAGELVSNEIEIKIRSLPVDEYEMIEMPIIFHILNPANKPSVAPIEITAETISKNIERLNNVFNGLVNTAPNGGNAKIIFRPALYDPQGIPLATPGVHSYQISDKDTARLEQGEDYRRYVWRHRDKLIYDYRHYLNIWLINIPQGSPSIVKNPTVIDNISDSIPGLKAEVVTEDFPREAIDVGFFINMSYFLNPLQKADYYEISTTMGTYLGLLNPEVVEFENENNIVAGDTDYCPDTHYWWSDNSSVFKNTGPLDSQRTDTIEWFTSYHIMDRYSYKNSLTCDQVRRVRLHLERCPSRWMYKSKFAFTGKHEE